MIDKYANRIAVAIKNANQEKTASVDVMQYGFIILFNGISVFSLSFTIGMITGMFYETFLTCITFALFANCLVDSILNQVFLCIVTSTIVLTTLPHIPVSEQWIMILTSVLVLPLFLVFAPSRIDQQTRIPRKYYPVLKVVCVILGDFKLTSYIRQYLQKF